jgi:hypothetical protein
LTTTRIRHSEFLGVFASKSGDTNSDSFETDPPSVAVESESSATRIRPSYFLFFLLIYVRTQIRVPDTRIQFPETRIRMSYTRIQHSEFFGVFASKSGDTNSDPFEMDPPSVAVESESSRTRICPSYFLFFANLCKDTNPDARHPDPI